MGGGGGSGGSGGGGGLTEWWWWCGLILRGNDIIYAKLQQENTVHLD